ncbi:metallophosphoesterase family protein [Tateyamaria sp. Alg231-49]|uniref:metallophosphoesterase family protein n=1 Tax=Tateyamaria sp. Alg231-49 TaxID=1922219 RepID=UPI000D559FE1|nr:metallophosphoesterase family protein [Tateyamaria sp. Alg231-49]
MFKRLFRRFVASSDFPATAPESPFIAVGDIHGCVDLLERYLGLEPGDPLVCVGDYVDRGDNSAEVLRLLHARPDIICLSGNHEEMMLDFLKDPAGSGARWLRYGGLQTLASFGVAGVTETSSADAMAQARDQLQDAMGPDLITWMKRLPKCWQSGNVAVVHAGADPAQSIENQTEKVLHWGHPDFAKATRTDGVWIVHGHTIVAEPTATRGRISIDTGAYATGRLTAALIEPGKTTFETIT